MGIPGYTKWLRTRFAGCFHALDLRKPLQSQHPRARRGYDHVHFDLAARLYLVAARAKSTPHLLKLWLTDLHRMSVWTAAHCLPLHRRRPAGGQAVDTEAATPRAHMAATALHVGGGGRR
jgi:hypothetical protein